MSDWNPEKYLLFKQQRQQHGRFERGFPTCQNIGHRQFRSYDQ